jgi:hypothetical protein
MILDQCAAHPRPDGPTLYADIAATSASALAALEGRPRERRRYWVALLSIWRRYTR